MAGRKIVPMECPALRGAAQVASERQRPIIEYVRNQMKETLEEHVARAMWDTFEEPMGEDAMAWDDAKPGAQGEFLDFARAAIKAVEEWHAEQK